MTQKTLPELGKKENSLYLLETEEGVDLLNAAVEATHAMRFNDSVVARHKSTESLLKAGVGFLGSSTKFHSIIQECIDVYWTTPTVRNIIDLMVDFASEKLKIEHRVDVQQRFYEEWGRRSGFYKIVPQIFHTLLLCGTCVIMRQEGKVSKTTVKQMSKASLDEAPITANRVPIGYSILNPTRISFEKSELFSERLVKFKLSQQDIAILKKPLTDYQLAIKKSLSTDFVNSAIKSGYVVLDPDRITVLNYKKLPWEDWAIPLIFSALDDINFKKMLRKMDESSAADVIKAVVIFRLGKMEDNLPPDRARFEKLSSLLKNVSQAKNIVWDNLIDIVDSFPPIEKILGKEKYEVVDRDILANFGVSQILVTGEAGNFSSGFLSVRTLQEKLETLRNNVLQQFIRPELDRLRQSVRFSKKPVVRFCSMSLRDEAAEKKLLLDLIDRKLIDPRSVQEVFGFDPEILAVRMEKAKKDKRIKQLSPLDPPPISKTPTSQVKKPGQPGRPTNTKSPQKNKRKTKPTGIGLSKEWRARVSRRVNSMIVGDSKNYIDVFESAIVCEMALYSLDVVDNLTDDLVKNAILKSQCIITEGTDKVLLARISALLEVSYES